MDNFKIGAHKYFLYGIQEYFFNKYGKIENKKMQSIVGLLDNFISLERSIKLSSGDPKKLNNAKKNLLESLLFNFSYTPLIKSREFIKDIESVKKLLEDSINNMNKELKDNEDRQKLQKKNLLLFNCLNSLNKKIKSINILNHLIDIHIMHDKSFKDVEILIDCYMSELMYSGYSLLYLKSWFKDKLNNDEINNAKSEEELVKIINKFRELSKNSEKEYEVKISINLPESLKRQIIENGKKVIDGIEYSTFSEDEKPRDTKFKVTQKSTLLKAVIKARDEIKAVDIMTSTIENYIEVYKAVDTSIGSIPITGCYTNHIIDLKSTQEYKRELSYREKEDIQEFIELRESNNSNSNTIKDIERVINVVQKLSSDRAENRLLNAWSALENILRFYDSKSIIGKITDIIPKLLVMYSIKRGMNNLWDRILPLINHGKIDIQELSECRSQSDPKKYNKEKFALFLMREKTGVKLYNNTKSNIIINKEVIDLHELLREPKILLEKINFDEEAIRHNITTIYRLRNDLVHNGGIIDKDIENKILILKYYINCILGTLIHHIKRNPELTIEEVLNSIILTYNQYIDNISKLKKETCSLYEELKKSGYKLRDLKGQDENEIKKIKNEQEKLMDKVESKICEFGIGNIAYMNYLYI